MCVGGIVDDTETVAELGKVNTRGKLSSELGRVCVCVCVQLAVDH